MAAAEMGTFGVSRWQLSKNVIISLASDEVDGGQLSDEATITSYGVSVRAEQCVQVQYSRCGHIGVLTAENCRA